jgi:glycosyltransferase involved in cell wall biosynthesis
MSRLRIMRVIARMNVGGPAVQVSGLMRHLPEADFDHRLFTGWCADDEADYLETQARDVEAIRIQGLGRAVKPGDDVRALRHLVREVRQFRPHIIHTHTAKAGGLGRAAARLSGVGSATVHTFHGHLLHGYFSPAKTRALVHLERRLASRTDRLVAVGAQVRDDLLAAGIGRPDQFVVIPPGLELPTSRPRDEVRAEFGLKPDAVVIAIIGRLTQIKRPDRFVEVVRQVARQGSDVHFLVAGSGDQSALVEDAAKALPITHLGWRSDVENVLAASDAVILTSDNEGTPLSLIQAGMAGLPVIASAVGSVPDVVIDGETGWLAPPMSDALAEATLAMLDEPLEASRRGQAGALRTHALYGVNRLADDHAKLYRSIASGRTPG